MPREQGGSWMLSQSEVRKRGQAAERAIVVAKADSSDADGPYAALLSVAALGDGAALIELHAVLHGVFGHLAESVGVVHVAATEAEHAELYVGDGRMFVELRAPELVELVAQTLARVDATWRVLPDAS